MLIATLGVACMVAFAVLSSSKTILNTGTVKTAGVSVYWESNCATPVSLIEWNDLVPGENRSTKVYVRNEGSVTVTLNMRTDNWNSTSASSCMELVWNLENYKLTSGNVVEAVLTLKVSSNITNVQGFSFDIIITGTEST
ncbi:MAG: hypothetical protein ACPLYF_03805 [Fervidobacterium sp.]